jgi:hypothetical protein
MVEAMPSAPNTERGRRRYNWVWYRILRRSNWPARSRPTQAKDDDIPYRRDLYLRRLVESAGSQFPTLYAVLAERDPNAFVQAIFDYRAPSMVNGRIALLGGCRVPRAFAYSNGSVEAAEAL